jgi:ATP-binding cassette subfamily C protein
MPVKKDDFRNITLMIKELLRVSGSKVFLSVLLQIVAGLTQGIGLLMLIPLLGMAGVIPSPQAASGTVGHLLRFLQQLGIPQGLITVLLFYILVVSITASISKYLEVVNATIQQGFIRSLKNRLYTAIGRSEWLFVSRLRMSDVAHEITVEVQRAGQMALQVFKGFGAIVTVLVYLVVAFLLSPAMAALSLAGAGVLWLNGRRKNRQALKLGKSTQKSVRKVYQVVLEHLAGMKIAKSFGEEERYVREFIHHSEEVENRRIEFVRLSSRTALLYSIGSVILLSLYVYAGIEVAGIEAPVLAALIYIFSRLMPRISALQSSYQSLLQSLPALDSVTRLQAECDLHRENLNRSDDIPLAIEHSILLQNLSFDYGNGPVLSGIDLEIEAGSLVCLTGDSGSGKTTLADLILGLLKPTAGQIVLDGQILDHQLLFQWRKSIGYVPQDSFLFNDTIRNNLMWANPGQSDADCLDALRKAAADAMVQQLKNGLNTIVGDRGAQLSGGERQRIALARALMRSPSLLILDEATNALDPHHEQMIAEALTRLKGRTTILVIAHSKAFHPIADKIIRLKHGKIVP